MEVHFTEICNQKVRQRPASPTELIISHPVALIFLSHGHLVSNPLLLQGKVSEEAAVG